VMAAIAPAHVTVVYPEEATDESLLTQRLERQLARVRSFPIDIRGVFDEAGGRGGVFLRAHDRVGTLAELKRGLLAHPFTPSAFPFHITVVHPRTSDRGPQALAAVIGEEVIGSLIVSELCWTETSATTQTLIRRFPLDVPRVQQVAAVLRRGTRVLLCHRNPARDYFPDVWDLPGGHVEAGEHAAIALARELQEELGIRVEDLPDIPTRVLSDDALNIDLSIWFVDSWRGDPANVAPQEHDGVAWYTSEQWSDLALAHQDYRPMLADAVGAQ
jgi:8-oxo-dGTP diphosphatase